MNWESLSVLLSSQYAGQPAADAFRNQLEKNGIDSIFIIQSKGYPTDMDHIISPEGMGKNDYIKTSRNLIVVMLLGPGSGKLATCMFIMYHDQINGIKSGYANLKPSQFGIFPFITQSIWPTKLPQLTWMMST